MGYVEDLRALIGHRCIILNGSVAIIPDNRGRILMQQRTQPYGKWGLPCGLMELGESTAETARREVLEETGLVLGELELLGVYSGEDYLCQIDNGDAFYVVTTAYIARQFTGIPYIADDESLQLCWFEPHALPEDIAGTHREIIGDYLKKITV